MIILQYNNNFITYIIISKKKTFFYLKFVFLEYKITLYILFITRNSIVPNVYVEKLNLVIILLNSRVRYGLYSFSYLLGSTLPNL